MNRFMPFAVVAVMSLVCVGEAGAACGGGGWKKPSSSKPANDNASAPAQSAPAKSASAPAQPAAPAAPAAPTTPPSSDSAAAASTGTSTQPLTTFDARLRAVSSQLKLDEPQSKAVAKVREVVASQVAILDKKLFQAEEKYARCTGACKEESRELDKASEAQRAYNARAEFEKELKTILTSSQWSLYTSAKVASTK